MRKYISILMYVAIMVIWAKVDANLNDQGLAKLMGDGIGNDIANFFIKYMIGFLLILLVWYESDVPYRWSVLGVFVIFSAVAWITFDLSYNIFRDNVALNHIGTSAIDLFFKKFKHPFVFQLMAKLLMLIFGLWLYNTEREKK